MGAEVRRGRRTSHGDYLPAKRREERYGVQPVWASNGVYRGEPTQMLFHMDRRSDWQE